jgi:hypothetical protein
MFRSMLVATALVAAGLPAHAQVRDELTSGAWTCWMTSLIGDPGMDANLAFNPDGSLDGWFFGEVPEGGDVIALEFSVAGSWTLNGSVITSTVESTELLSGSFNGEAFTAEDIAEMSGPMSEELSAFSGESTVAYIAAHAMVLEEADASISCWR